MVTTTIMMELTVKTIVPVKTLRTSRLEHSAPIPSFPTRRLSAGFAMGPVPPLPPLWPIVLVQAPSKTVWTRARVTTAKWRSDRLVESSSICSRVAHSVILVTESATSTTLTKSHQSPLVTTTVYPRPGMGMHGDQTPAWPPANPSALFATSHQLHMAMVTALQTLAQPRLDPFWESMVLSCLSEEPPR